MSEDESKSLTSRRAILHGMAAATVPGVTAAVEPPGSTVPNVSGESVRLIATRALALTMNFSSDVSAIRTAGFDQVGDGGAALYSRASPASWFPGSIQTADGAWWEICEAIPNVKMYGARGDGVTDDTLAIQRALDGNRGRILIVPKGTYIISSPLVITQGNRLLGEGTTQNNLTCLKLAASANCNVIETAGWSKRDLYATNHWCEIGWLTIDGNNAQNTDGVGLAIWQSGETTDIHNLQIKKCSTHGLHAKGIPAPLRLRNITVNDSREAGFKLEGSGVITLDHPSGDNNLGAFIDLTGQGGGKFVVNHLKAEAQRGHDVIIDVAGPSFKSLLVLGGYANGSGKTFVRVKYSGAPHAITLLNSEMAGSYVNSISDVTSGKDYKFSHSRGILCFGAPMRSTLPVIFDPGDYLSVIVSNSLMPLIRSSPRGTAFQAVTPEGGMLVDDVGGAVAHWKRRGFFWASSLNLGGSVENPSVLVRHGNGNPEGRVPASIGSLYLRVDGLPGSTLYVKENGAGATGWVAK